MSNLIIFAWFLSGPFVGYVAAKRRDASIIVGVLLGFMCGPCIGALLIPVILGYFTGEQLSSLPPNSTGRSHSTEDLIDPSATRRLPPSGAGNLISIEPEAEEKR